MPGHLLEWFGALQCGQNLRGAWQLAVGGDLAPPEIEGPRPLSMRLANKYVDRVQTAAETNLSVAAQFLKVAGFSSPPASLFAPSVVFRVAAINWQRGRAHSPELASKSTPDAAQGGAA
jgi:hypothetical protein